MLGREEVVNEKVYVGPACNQVRVKSIEIVAPVKYYTIHIIAIRQSFTFQYLTQQFRKCIWNYNTKIWP